ncbi:hypothetical protein AUL54_14735 [Bacillus sp. SDLI1]|nr:hypothetical protein AUL54_14735 [Bacillus sp. SDLI1]
MFEGRWEQVKAAIATELERLGGKKTSSPAKTKTKANGATYTVKKGDALSVVAQKTGVSMATLQRLNGIKDPNLIKVGQVLKLKGSKAQRLNNHLINKVSKTNNSNLRYNKNVR